MPTSGNDSAISRLLDEISWEGNAKKYRGGGRHPSNMSDFVGANPAGGTDSNPVPATKRKALVSKAFRHFRE
jgi:hypothetical protein